jgi:glutathione S-transferase
MRLHKPLGLDLEAFPRVRAWLEAIGERPAVQRGLATLRAPKA